MHCNELYIRVKQSDSKMLKVDPYPYWSGKWMEWEIACSDTPHSIFSKLTKSHVYWPLVEVYYPLILTWWCSTGPSGSVSCCSNRCQLWQTHAEGVPQVCDRDTISPGGKQSITASKHGKRFGWFFLLVRLLELKHTHFKSMLLCTLGPCWHVPQLHHTHTEAVYFTLLVNLFLHKRSWFPIHIGFQFICLYFDIPTPSLIQ